MLPTIFTAFLYGFLYHFLSFPAFHAFSIFFFQGFVSFSFRSFLHHFLWLLSHFPALSLYFSSMFTASSLFVPSSRSGFLHVPTDFAPFILVVITFSCQVVITFSFTVSFQHFPVDFARFPLIVIMFSCSFYIPFVGFRSIRAFLIHVSKIFTRLLFAPFPLVCCIFQCICPRVLPVSLIFPIVFAPFPLVVIAFSCTFTVFFPTCLLHRHSLFLAVTPVSSMFQRILHGLFLAFSSDRYHVFLKFHCIFQYILFVGFQYVLSSIFFTTCFLSFSPLSSIGVCTISSGFLHFHTFSILILIQEFYLTPSFFRSFLHPLLSLLSHCPALSLYFSSMITASSWFAPSIRSGFLHFPRDFPWFVPSIRSVFVRFPGDFVRFPLIVIMFSCSFIVFSNTSSWSLRPPKRRT